MAYTFVAMQELILYHQYPSIYWNTATLTVNSGSVEEDELLESNNGEEIQAKNKNTDYGKVAKAIGDLQQRDVEVTLPLINQANYSFIPDEENNRIIFGFRGIHGIGTDVANTIVNLRPYKSFEDFYNKTTNIDKNDIENVKIQNAKIITLIKAGCFDELEQCSRIEVMQKYIRLANEPKTKLNMQNWRAIKEYQIIPDKFNTEERIINFKDYILRKENFLKVDDKFKSKKIYQLSNESEAIASISENFFQEHFVDVMKEDKHYWYNENGKIELYDSDLRRFTDKKTEKLRDWLLSDESLKLYNDAMYKEIWKNSCSGNISKWEMDSVSFYSHDHELISVDMNEYNVVDFYDLPEVPEVIGKYKWRGRLWDEFAIHRIIGTVLDRNKAKHTVSLLTPTGVVTLKMYSGNFSHYDKQVSKKTIKKGKEKKQIIESSWFTRGNLLSVVGFRRGATFIPKKYRSSVYQHTIQKITEVKKDGSLVLQSEREVV